MRFEGGFGAAAGGGAGGGARSGLPAGMTTEGVTTRFGVRWGHGLSLSPGGGLVVRSLMDAMS